MYCPRCAAENLNDVKFCRGCGANLETVALALSGHYDSIARNQQPADTWLQKRNESVRQLVKAISLLASSLLVGVALGLLSNTNDWIMVWLVFAGWMAVWGVFSLVAGINGLIETKFLRQQMEHGAQGPDQIRQTGERTAIADGLAAPRTSVTEHTTKQLTKPQP